MAYLQASAFLRICGDIWYRCNRETLGKEDPVSSLIEFINWQPKRVLEIGCANGWRLKNLQEKYSCEVAGLEPSEEAIKNAVIEDIYRGTAENLPYLDNYFDTIIYGFCFSYIDPPDYFRVLFEGDRVLREGGLIFLHDKATAVPLKRHQYGFTAIHKETKEEQPYEVMLHTMDFTKLWTGNPCYKQINRLDNPNNFDFVSAIQKNIGTSFLEGSPAPRTDGMLLTDDGHPIYPEKEDAA